MAKGTDNDEWAHIENAINQAKEEAFATADSSKGQSAVFVFARIVKGWTWANSQTKNPTAPSLQQILKHIESSFAEYHQQFRTRVRPADVWMTYFPQSGDGRAEFISAYGSVRVAKGQTLWEAVESAVSRLPLRPLNPMSDKYCQFLTIAGHLQRARAKNQAIQLPVKLLAKVLGVTPMMITNYRRWAQKDGLLLQLRPHNTAAKRATDFMFQVDKFNWETGQQIPDPRRSAASDTNVYQTQEFTLTRGITEVFQRYSRVESRGITE